MTLKSDADIREACASYIGYDESAVQFATNFIQYKAFDQDKTVVRAKKDASSGVSGVSAPSAGAAGGVVLAASSGAYSALTPAPNGQAGDKNKRNRRKKK